MSVPDAIHPQDLRAAEYALGVLEGAALSEAEALERSDTAFAQAVEIWELRLAVLCDHMPAVRPPDRVWEAISLRLGPAAANDNRRWWNSLDVWRGLTAASLAIAAVAVGLLVTPNLTVGGRSPPPTVVVAQAPWTAVVSAPEGGPKLAAVTVDSALKRIVVTPLGLTEEEARSLELWVVPADGSAPRSLGLVKAGRSTVLEAALPVDARGAALAISREPAGGSPTGAPTGPILGVGALAET